MSNKSADIDTMILVGGKGTRLKSLINDRPKCLVEIGGKPIIDYILDNLTSQGLNKIILCSGFMHDLLYEHINLRKYQKIKFSFEKIPLGTGGALFNAKNLVDSDHFIVLNGDTICDINFNHLVEFHLKNDSYCTIVVNKGRKSNLSGNIYVDKKHKITNFEEKIKINGSNLLNAGVYIFKRDFINTRIMGKNFSLEYDILPDLVKKERCFAYSVSNSFFDMGTPEGYYQTEKYLSRKKTI